MDGATRNAGQLIKKVTLYCNKTRQGGVSTKNSWISWVAQRP